MTELRFFFEIFFEALRKAILKPEILLFGMVLAITNGEYISSLTSEGAPFEKSPEWFLTIFEKNPFALIFLIILGIFFSTLIKGALILFAYETKTHALASIKMSARKISKTFTLDFFSILSFIVLFGIFMLPGILTLQDPELSYQLKLLGAVLFIPISGAIFLLEIYAFFYIVLSGISLRESLNLGYQFLSKHTATTVIFAISSILFFLTLSIIFSSIAIFLTGFITEYQTSAILLSSLFIIGFLLSAQKVAWLLFFKKIGKNKEEKETSQEKDSMIQREVSPTQNI